MFFFVSGTEREKLFYIYMILSLSGKDQQCKMKFGSWTYDGFMVGTIIAKCLILLILVLTPLHRNYFPTFFLYTMAAVTVVGPCREDDGRRRY